MLCFRQFPIAKKIFRQRGVGRLGRKEYQGFSSRRFCLVRPKCFVEECFSVWLNSGIRKVYELEGGGWSEDVSRYFFRYFLLHNAQFVRRRPF